LPSISAEQIQLLIKPNLVMNMDLVSVSGYLRRIQTDIRRHF